MQINLSDKSIVDEGEFNRILARARSKKCILDSSRYIEEYRNIPQEELESNPRLKYHVNSVLDALSKKERRYKYFTPTGSPELCHIFCDSHNEIEKLGYHIYFLDKKSVVLSMDDFLDISLKKDILCLLFERFQLDKNYETILNCLKLIEKNHNKKIHLKNGFVFIIEYGIARICKKDISKSFYEELTLENSCEILNKYHFHFLKKPPQNNAIYIKLCYNSLKLPFYIRNRQPGDFIEMSYGNKKISRIFIDEKIPNEKRDQIPLIFNQDGALLWVYNLAKSKQVYEQKDTGDIYLVCEEVKA